MTIEQLRYFDAIAECGSFSKVSEQFAISQSSLTKQVKSLENELDVSLFERSNRRVSITPVGQELLVMAKRILQEHQAMVALSDKQQKTVRVAVLPIIRQYNLLPIIEQYQQQNPSVTIKIEEMLGHDLLHSFSGGKCDLVITRMEMLPPDRYNMITLAEDCLCLFAHRDHPLAKEASVTIRQLEHEKLLLMPKGTYIAQICQDLCRAQGFTPNVVLSAQVETILAGIEAGYGCSLLMAKAQTVFPSSSIKVIPLRPVVKSTIVLATSKNSHKKPPVLSFSHYLQQVSSQAYWG